MARSAFEADRHMDNPSDIEVAFHHGQKVRDFLTRNMVQGVVKKDENGEKVIGKCRIFSVRLSRHHTNRRFIYNLTRAPNKQRYWNGRQWIC